MKRAPVAAAFALLLVALTMGACDTSSPPATPSQALATVEPTPSPTPTPTPSPSASPTPSPSPSPSPTSTPTPTASATTAAQAEAPAATSTPSATKIVKTFKVYGNTPDKLLASDVAQSQKPCGSTDTLACVRQSRDVSWLTEVRAGTNACVIASATVKLDSTVWLPRWIKPSSVPAALPGWWNLMLAHFAWHENQHIAIEKRYDQRIIDSLIGQPCSKAGSIVQSWGRTIDRAQARFDLQDSSWQYPPYP